MNYLLDSNILLYAKMSLMPEHLLVSKWLEDAVLDQNNTINICERVRVKCCGNEFSRLPFLTSHLPVFNLAILLLSTSQDVRFRAIRF